MSGWDETYLYVMNRSAESLICNVVLSLQSLNPDDEADGCISASLHDKATSLLLSVFNRRTDQHLRSIKQHYVTLFYGL